MVTKKTTANSKKIVAQVPTIDIKAIETATVDTSNSKDVSFYYLRRTNRTPIATVAFQMVGSILVAGISWVHPEDRSKYSRKTARGNALENFRKSPKTFDLGPRSDAPSGIHPCLQALSKMAKSKDPSMKTRHGYGKAVEQEIERQRRRTDAMNLEEDLNDLLNLTGSKRDEVETRIVNRQETHLKSIDHANARFEEMRDFVFNLSERLRKLEPTKAQQAAADRAYAKKMVAYAELVTKNTTEGLPIPDPPKRKTAAISPLLKQLENERHQMIRLMGL